MPALGCLSGIYGEIALAMDVLKQRRPMSPVISWWDSEGRYAHFLVSVEDIPSEELEVVCGNISYVRDVLQNAIQAEDVEDIESVVTRLVSDIKDVAVQYQQHQP